MINQIELLLAAGEMFRANEDCAYCMQGAIGALLSWARSAVDAMRP